jgi:hypothetical protein
MRRALLPLLAWVAINFTVGCVIYWQMLGAGQVSQVSEVWSRTISNGSRCLSDDRCREILLGGKS